MTDVPLTWHELHRGADVGVLRNLTAWRNGMRSTYGEHPTDGRWERHVNGAIGEQVIAKALGLYWQPNIGGRDVEGDVGRWQVRTSARRGLIIREGDLDEAPFVLVVGTPPRFTIVGWLYGYEARQLGREQDYNNGRPPCIEVDRELLHPWVERPYEVEL